jgi:OOP family OmpA-OmpF porin
MVLKTSHKRTSMVNIMSHRRLASIASIAVGAAVAISSATVYAQTAEGGIALNQLDPSPAGDQFFSLPSPHVVGHLVPRGFAMFDYANGPLVVFDGPNRGAIVATQAFVHVGASMTLWNRLLVHAHLPLAVLQAGDSPTLAGILFPSPSGFEVGDIRLGARIRLHGEPEGPISIALGATIHLPTARADGYAGEGAVRLAPEVIAGGQVWRIAWSAAIRPTFRTSDNPATLQYGAGAAFVLGDRLHVGPEIQASTPIQEGFIRVSDGKAISRGSATNAELLLGARGRIVSNLWIGAAGGVGLTSALGTPAWRAIGTISWSPSGKTENRPAAAATTDSDSDGILDTVDACRYAFGPAHDDVRRHGCPLLDRDEDSVSDVDDACPDEPGQDAKRRGCPADRDNDGVQDALDRCPDIAGDAALFGCSEKK